MTLDQDGTPPSASSGKSAGANGNLYEKAKVSFEYIIDVDVERLGRRHDELDKALVAAAICGAQDVTPIESTTLRPKFGGEVQTALTMETNASKTKNFKQH